MRDLSASPALPIANGILRILVIANCFYGAAILVLLLFLPTERWILSELGLTVSAEADRVVFGLRAVAVIGLLAVPLNYVVLSRLRAMVGTARAGDPFVAANAARLHSIAWALLALQVLSLIVGMIGRSISTPSHPIHLDAGFSVAGWLAVLLTFVLARVFSYGTGMREELEATV